MANKELAAVVRHQKAHLAAERAAREEDRRGEVVTVTYNIRTKWGTVLWVRCIHACFKCQAREGWLMNNVDWDECMNLPLEMPEVANATEPAAPPET